MKNLARRAFEGMIQFQVFMLALLLVPAWTVDFWEAWVYWGVFFVCVLCITLWLLKNDPGLVESRMKAGPRAEQRRSQRVIQTLASVVLCTTFIVPGIERRIGSTVLAVPVVLGADLVVVLAFVLLFVVMRTNSHASGVIEVQANQQVVTTGPYRIVRHPMYAAALLLFAATPIALGSLWGLICVVLFAVILAARLIDEEKYLSANLPGYEEYCRNVRCRLIPFVW